MHLFMSRHSHTAAFCIILQGLRRSWNSYVILFVGLGRLQVGQATSGDLIDRLNSGRGLLYFSGTCIVITRTTVASTSLVHYNGKQLFNKL